MVGKSKRRSITPLLRPCGLAAGRCGWGLWLGSSVTESRKSSVPTSGDLAGMQRAVRVINALVRWQTKGDTAFRCEESLHPAGDHQSVTSNGHSPSNASDELIPSQCPTAFPACQSGVALRFPPHSKVFPP